MGSDCSNCQRLSWSRYDVTPFPSNTSMRAGLLPVTATSKMRSGWDHKGILRSTTAAASGSTDERGRSRQRNHDDRSRIRTLPNFRHPDIALQVFRERDPYGHDGLFTRDETRSENRPAG